MSDETVQNMYETQNIIQIICFGDSITAGSKRGIWSEDLDQKLNALNKCKFKVINAGVSANSTANAFDRLDTDIIANMPALVIIEFGINDSNHRPWAKVPRVSLAEYEKNFREFQRIINLYGGMCIFVINHPINALVGKSAIQGNGKTFQENLNPYNDLIRTLATEFDVPTVDMPLRLKEKNVNLDHFLIEDGIHLSEYGSIVYGDIIFEELLNILKKNQLIK